GAPGPFGGDLASALVGCVAGARSRGLRIELEIGELPRSPELGTILFQLVREGVTNAERHAPGSSVVVSVACDASECVARVSDDGAGRPDQTGAGTVPGT